MKSKGAAMSNRAHPINWHKLIVFWGVVVLGALPAIWLIWAFFADELGANPVSTINNVTGRAAMILLLASLAFTPVNTIFGLHEEYRVRRALGLWAFAYAALHFLNFVGLDYGFDLQYMLADGVAAKPYIIAGTIALLLLTLLAITSNMWSIRKLGPKWKRLHSTVYIIAVLVILHFFWQAKVAERWEPLLYGLALALLLIVRIPAVRGRLARLRGSE
jgi:methionine sulfoxide reductase heme-binding subunit